MGWRERVPAARYDAVVVGSGPNGLAAALTLAEAGKRVLVLEAAATPGGGTRTRELTLPGFHHDVCSTVHPLGIGSPFFRRIDLRSLGVEWLEPPLAVAHPFDDGSAAELHQSLVATEQALGVDGRAWRRAFEPYAERWTALSEDLLRPLLRLPSHPFWMLRFCLAGMRSARGFARSRFRTAHAQALFAGIAAHCMLPLDGAFTASFGLVLGMTAHALGWPFARGGSQAIAGALLGRLRALGVDVVTEARVERLEELPPASAVLCDVTPRQLLALAGDRLSPRERRRLGRYRYGPGVFKLDLALDGPCPWTALACRRAGTVHLGCTLEEIADAEAAVNAGRLPPRPFVIVTQPSLFDDSRAPAGRHVLWAYCHVPNGSRVDMSEAILDQIERFAPGLRQRILARHTFDSAALEAYDANYVGGDINGGAQDLVQLFGRPLWSFDPYTTSAALDGGGGVYLCSSSTPPGGGVHGMCGFLAARAALRRWGKAR